MKKYILLFLTALIIISCQKNKEEHKIDSDKSFKITDFWMRAGVKDRNTAGFMNFVNNTDKADTLFSVQSDLAEIVELHETFTTENDMKGMRHIEEIIIPANSTMELKPGSYHIMFIGLYNDVNLDEKHFVTLGFKNQGEVKVELPVK